MKCFAIAAALFAGAAFAAPTLLDERQTNPCLGTNPTPQCCATDVLGVADLDCQTPNGPFATAADFTATCAAGGQRARCCTLPIVSPSARAVTSLEPECFSLTGLLTFAVFDIARPGSHLLVGPRRLEHRSASSRNPP